MCLDDGGINDYITSVKEQDKLEVKEKIMTIEERFGKEVDLIEKFA